MEALLVALAVTAGGCRAVEVRRPNAFFAARAAGAAASGDAATAFALSAVVAQARRAVVSVIAERAAEPSPFGEEGATRRRALGSGFVIAADGLVLTARHVIDGAEGVRVDMDDGRSFPGAVVARDAVLDVALVRLEGARGLPVAALGSSGAIHVGDRVIAIGNPFGLGPSVSLGILSASARAIEDGPCHDGAARDPALLPFLVSSDAEAGAGPGGPGCGLGPGSRYLQTDAAMNPGNSGGPLLDERGQVVGVNAAILEHGQGIGFAVPIDDVRAVLDELRATGRVTRGYAGIELQTVDEALARALGLSSPAGALVSGVDAAGPADRAGVRPGDLVTAEDGLPLARAEDLSRELFRRKPGQVIHLTLRRIGGVRTVSVTLARLPNRDGDAEVAAPRAPRPAGVTGLHFRDASGGGALVDGIDPASTAADGLHRGDIVVEVDHTPVATAADATRRLASRRPVLVRIRRDGVFLYVGLDLGHS